MARVYVSSTVLDLKAERQAVIDWLVQARHQPVHSYLPDSETVRDSCLADIDGCDLYVLILGHRYGFVPGNDNPEGLSITHLEFRCAIGRPLPCVALLRTSVPDIQLSDLQDPARSKQVFAFRSEVENRLRPGQFSNLAELIATLSAGIQNELAKLAAGPVEPARIERVVPAPSLRLPQHPIVGREPLIEIISERLRAGRRSLALVYLAGVGKTAVAAELIQRGAVTDLFPDGVLWAHLGADPDVRRQLRKWAKSLGLSDAEIGNCDRLMDLREAISQAIGERRLLLLVDDVWKTEDGEHFNLGGPGCAFLITTRHPGIARELMPTVDDLIEVRKLGPEDGFRLLAELAPHAAELAPTALNRFVTRVDGLPIALVLIGKMLKMNGDDRHAVETVEMTLTDINPVFREKKLAEFNEDQNFSLGEIIEASYSALGLAGTLNRDELTGAQLRQALEALSVLRPDPAWFTTALAGLVTGAPPKVLRDLCDAGLIEAVRYTGKDDEPRYTMHRMVAEYIRGKLSPQRCQALNRVAADYYLSQLQALEKKYQEGETSSYAMMYRYEDQEWQDCQDNWLSYFAQTGYDQEASLSFLRVWFDGFWWWSCFTDEGYDFCDQLLIEWEHRLSLSTAAAPQTASDPAPSAARVERRVRGLDLLRRFKRAYPKETQERNTGTWSEVATTLRELRNLVELDDPAGPHDENGRQVRALTDIFLAEAARFGNDDLAAAEASYREALALFRDAGDTWNIAWVLYHLADLLAGHSRCDEARLLCGEALPLGQSGGDHEVMALACRVLGDCALAVGDVAEALRGYRLAVEHAYRFQVEPQDPDDYTVQFYADMARLVAQRLLDRHVSQPDQARQIALGLRAAWVDCGAELAAMAGEDKLITGADAETLATRLFPPTLELQRRKSDGAAYAQTVRAHLPAAQPAGVA